MELFGSLGQTWTGMSVLDAQTKMRMNPLQLRKAGAIIENMQSAGYNEERINLVCRALFFQEDEDMLPAWKVFDVDGSGALDAEEFKKALALMGENVSDVMVEAMFKHVDTDGSGRIEYSEFVVLVKGMNPKEEAQKEGEDTKEGEESGLGSFFGSIAKDLESTVAKVSVVPGMPDRGGDKEGSGGSPAEERKAKEGEDKPGRTGATGDQDGDSATAGDTEDDGGVFGNLTKFAPPKIDVGFELPGMGKEEEEQMPEEPKFGRRGTLVRSWRAERARKYQEILESGEESHDATHNALLDKKAQLEAQMKELEDLQAQKEREIAENEANKEETLKLCGELVVECVMGFEDMEEILEAKKRKWSKKLFKSFAGERNHLEMEQFSSLIRLIDDSATEADIANLFASAGVTEWANGRMGEREFHRWAASCFGGDALEEEFRADVDEVLLKQSSSQSVQAAKLPGSITETKAEWVRRVFGAYDDDDSGFIDVNEFHALLSAVDESITYQGVEKMFKDCGVKDGLMDISKMYVWANMVFGDEDEDEFITMMKELMAASPKYEGKT